MINPFYYFFYLFYKILRPLAREEDRIPFAITSFMAIMLVVHMVILLITIKTQLNYDISILPNSNKYVIGAIVVVIYFVLSNVLFEKNNRYLKLVERIKNTKTYRKITAAVFLLTYFLAPLIIRLIV